MKQDQCKQLNEKLRHIEELQAVYAAAVKQAENNDEAAILVRAKELRYEIARCIAELREMSSPWIDGYRRPRDLRRVAYKEGYQVTGEIDMGAQHNIDSFHALPDGTIVAATTDIRGDAVIIVQTKDANGKIRREELPAYAPEHRTSPGQRGAAEPSARTFSKVRMIDAETITAVGFNNHLIIYRKRGDRWEQAEDLSSGIFRSQTRKDFEVARDGRIMLSGMTGFDVIDENKDAAHEFRECYSHDIDNDSLRTDMLPDGRFVTGDGSNRVMVWGTEPPQGKRWYGIPKNMEDWPKKELGDAEIRAHNALLNSGLRKIKNREKITALTTTPDGDIAAGNSSGKVYVWRRVAGDAPDGSADEWITEKIITAKDSGGSPASIQDIQLLPDGRVVFSGDDRKVRICTQRNGTWETAEIFVGFTPAAECIQVLPDGRILASRLAQIAVLDGKPVVK